MTQTAYALTFTVPGKPAPQGSKNHVGHGRMIESSKEVGPWRERVAIAAHNALIETGCRQVFTGPITLDVDFVMPRIKSLPKTRPAPSHTKKPDLDKLLRAVGDALTGIVYRDDSQITHAISSKRYARIDEIPGANIRIEVYP